MSDQTIGLIESIPANNIKIIELYNKLKTRQTIVNASYQRKLVWKELHKINFIDTILKNFPFPEVYLAQSKLDQENLMLIDEIVDGQQRLMTIKDYIEGTDVFAFTRKSLKKFSELDSVEKSRFLNYEVSVRYLKNVSPEQIIEIFQRINKTDYALNTIERLNASWGTSEFVCFAKQLIDPDFELDDLGFKIEDSIRNKLSSFFNGENGDEEFAAPFTENDNRRMLSDQFIMILVATLESGEYFNRNAPVKDYIEQFNNSFPQGPKILEKLEAVVDFILGLKLEKNSRWYKKANIFTLIVELFKADLNIISVEKFGKLLKLFDEKTENYKYDSTDTALTTEEKSYLAHAKEAVNEKQSREFRGQFVANYINMAIKS